MKKTFLIILAALMLITPAAWGGTLTTNHNLYKPDYGESGSTWWSEINANFDLIDSLISNVWISASLYATIELANTAAYAAGKLLVISQNYTLTANTTMTARVMMLPGGSFTKASTYTLSFSSSYENPSNSQAFIGFSAGDVTFGAGTGIVSNPVHWGFATSASAAVNAVAFNSAAQAMPVGASMIIPDGSYPVTNVVWNPPSNCTLICRGTLTTSVAGAGITLTIGDSTVNKYRYKIEKLNVTSTINDWTSGRIGILAQNLSNSKIEINNVEYFEIGLQTLGTNSKGNIYNRYDLSRMWSNKIQLDIAVANSGWNNECNFYGGEFSIISGLGDYTGTIGIRAVYDATHQKNQHRFYGPGFEGTSTTTLPVSIEGLYFHFYGIRHEGVGKLTFGTHSDGCRIWGGSYLESEVDDQGIRNIFVSQTGFSISGGSAGIPTLSLTNDNGDTQNVLVAKGFLTGYVNANIRGDGIINTNAWYELKGNQILNHKQGGWVTMAGTAVKDNSGINADTITASDANIQALAKAVKALMDALFYHGLVGHPVHAQGTITVSDHGTVGETFRVGNRLYYWVDTRSAYDEVSIGTTAAEAVTNIVTALNLDPNNEVTAVDGAGDTVTVTAVIAGEGGNLIRFFNIDSVNLTFDGAGYLTGGQP